jgi:RES domain-containing protein
LTFNARQRAGIKRCMGQAFPLKGDYFRSFEYRYMDPADVLSGAETRAHGGRFAAVGIRAVCLSATDSGASNEITARKARLCGAAQISTDKYPRVAHAVALSLKRALELFTLGSSHAGEAVRLACLDKAESWNRIDFISLIYQHLLARVEDAPSQSDTAYPSD